MLFWSDVMNPKMIFIGIHADEKTFKAGSLWEKSGAVIMAVRRPG